MIQISDFVSMISLKTIFKFIKPSNCLKYRIFNSKIFSYPVAIFRITMKEIFEISYAVLQISNNTLQSPQLIFFLDLGFFWLMCSGKSKIEGIQPSLSSIWPNCLIISLSSVTYRVCYNFLAQNFPFHCQYPT